MSSEVKIMDCRNGCGAQICFTGEKSVTGKAIPQEVDPYTLEITGPHSCPKSAYALKQSGQQSPAPTARTIVKKAIAAAGPSASSANAVSQLAALREIAVNTRALPEVLAILRKLHPDLEMPEEEQGEEVEQAPPE